MLSKKLFPQQILKLIFLNVKQMAFTLMNEEFEFLYCLMTPSFNKNIRPHSTAILTSTVIYYVYYYSILLSFLLVISHH